MCAIYAYIDPPNHPNVGKYGIHGAFGIYISKHFRRSPQDFLTPCPAPQEESDIITESTSQKYFADFHALLTKPSCREVAVQGPRRDNKAEAIKECQTAPDCEILRKTFENEGELGVKRIAESLRTKVADGDAASGSARAADPSWGGLGALQRHEA
ncbi:Hypothetical protein (Fragment) [Durusdinium trenchii]|uniref:Uncharacterized protein n=1 Tax=Durusdinium trenchii TaxID=1381693 RepID=A0ABP0KII0_9DINO